MPASARPCSFQLGGVSNGIGLLAAGSFPLNIQWQNLLILQPLEASIAVFLGPSGQVPVSLTIPLNANLGYAHLYQQSGLLDASTPSGRIASDGLDPRIR